jgi:predicted transglutaminase-like cysteine proteinase
MANQCRAIAKFSSAGLAFGFFAAIQTAPVHAIPLSRGAWPIYTAVAEKMTPRPGWAEFCRKYGSTCDAQSTPLHRISLTPKVCDKFSDDQRKQKATSLKIGDTIRRIGEQGLVLRAGLPREANH